MGTFGDRISRDRHCDIGCGNAARFSDNGIDAASGPASRGSPSSVTERILAASPWTGTGAGTFAALIPIYRDADDAVTEHSPPNVATKIAIEAGRPAVWTVLFIAIAAAAVLFRGALRRGRDSFYSAAGAGCVVTIVLLSFTDAGMLQTRNFCGSFRSIRIGIRAETESDD